MAFLGESLPSMSAVRVRFPAGLRILISTLGLERGPLTLMRIIEWLLDMKSSEIRLNKLK